MHKEGAHKAVTTWTANESRFIQKLPMSSGRTETVGLKVHTFVPNWTCIRLPLCLTRLQYTPDTPLPT